MIYKRNALGLLAAVGLAAGGAQADGPVIHAILEGVKHNGDGTFTAVFGYQNDSEEPVRVAAGEDNKFTPAVSVEPVTVFQPGRVRAAFEVPFDGENLVWTLESPDGSRRTSTASRDSHPFEAPAAEEELGSDLQEPVAPEAAPPVPAPLNRQLPELFLPPMPVDGLPVVPPTPTPKPTATPEPTGMPEPTKAPAPTPEPVDSPDEFTLPKAEIEPEMTPASEPTPTSPPPDFEPEATPGPEATPEFLLEPDDEPSS